jgi:hypothetical protein
MTAGTLPVAAGGTGLTSPGTSGNVLTSTGSAWASTAPASSVATGTIIQYGSSTTPSGYLKCDGSTYNISSYSALATVLGSLPANSAAYSVSLTTGKYSVYYVNGNVIWMGSGDGTYAYSTDLGVTATTKTLSPYNSPSDMIVWTGTNYVSRPTDPCASLGGIVYQSTLSGSSWTAVTTGVNIRVAAMVYTGSRVVVMGQNVSYYSTNSGVSWTAGGAQTAYAPQQAVYAASIIVSVGRTTGYVLAIRTSPDGGTWTTQTVPTGTLGDTFYYLTYQNSLFIAVTNSGSICSSSDGVTWTLKTAISPVAGQVIYNSSIGAYVAYGKADIYYSTLSWYSTDLITWYQFPSNNSGFSLFTNLLATDGTKIWTTTYGVATSAQTYVPFNYTTGTQFVVPNFGGNALAGARYYAGQWGAYWYIKT